jgi:hypothetical protein
MKVHPFRRSCFFHGKPFVRVPQEAGPYLRLKIVWDEMVCRNRIVEEVQIRGQEIMLDGRNQTTYGT